MSGRWPGRGQWSRSLSHGQWRIIAVMAAVVLGLHLLGFLLLFAVIAPHHYPVRKVFYNLTITGLSVAVALVIGTIELTGLLAEKLGAQGAFWAWVENVSINTLGLIIAGMFLATWTIAVAVWRLGRIEERWSSALDVK